MHKYFFTVLTRYHHSSEASGAHWVLPDAGAVPSSSISAQPGPDKERQAVLPFLLGGKGRNNLQMFLIPESLLEETRDMSVHKMKV